MTSKKTYIKKIEDISFKFIFGYPRLTKSLLQIARFEK